MEYPSIESLVGNTPLVRLQRLPGVTSNHVPVKLEDDNPAGSVKDRPVLSMIRCAEERGNIAPGDVLVEVTSGNTGIALAMAAAIKGYRMKLIMPANMSKERKASMSAYGADGKLGAGEPRLTMLDREDLEGLIGNRLVYGHCGGGPWEGPVTRWVGGLGHELGHAFALPHQPGAMRDFQHATTTR